MDSKEELAYSLLENVNIKTENEDIVKCEKDYWLEKTIKEIKEEKIVDDEFKPKFLSQEYDITDIKSEYNNSRDYHIEPTSNEKYLHIGKQVANNRNKKNKRWYICLVCQKHFATYLQRKSHLTTHFNKNCVICIFCGKIFIQTELYLFHYFSHYLKIRAIVKSKYVKRCKKRKFRMRHNGDMRCKYNVLPKLFINKSYAFKCNVNRRMPYTEDKSCNGDIYPNDCTNKVCDTKEKLFKCKMCSKCFTQKGSLKSHIRRHTGEKPFPCTICYKRFVTKGDLKRHMRSHTGEKLFKCEICSQRFSTKTHLSCHIRRHTGEKPFKCEKCSRSFSENSSLNRHMRSHKGERPFKCAICPKSFTRKFNLKIHMYSHTGEKMSKCEICSKYLSTSSNLTKHMRRHTGEKPFQCKICSKMFRENCSLKRHLRCHTGDKQFQCEICFKSFTDESNFRRHLHCHSGEKPFKCEICPKGFTQKSGLTRHVQSHFRKTI